MCLFRHTGGTHLRTYRGAVSTRTIFHADTDVVSPFARNFTRNPVPQRRIGGDSGTDFEQLVQGGCPGCNVVISDKRLPGDTHCAPLAASTLRLPSARRSACRPMFTHTHVTNRARHVPLVTVHYVANRDISLGHHPSDIKTSSVRAQLADYTQS